MSISRKLITAAGGGGGEYVDDLFSTYLYEGGPSNRDIVNGIDLDDKGGLVWIKSRTSAEDHQLVDTERGADRSLQSNTTAAENVANHLTSFNSDGFSLNGWYTGVSNDGDYASWTFAKQEGFFDVVSYVGDGTNGRTIPHNLKAVPGMVICKAYDAVSSWAVKHKDMPTLEGKLETTAAFAANGNFPASYAGFTEDAFTVDNGASTNSNGVEYIAYVFAHDDSDESLIKCGTYEGNGNTDGPEIDLGFEPQWLLIKDVDGPGGWQLNDVMRTISTDYIDPTLEADTGGGELSFTALNILPTGFKVTETGTFSRFNKVGYTHVYMAIRRPNKPAAEFNPDELFAAADDGSSNDPRYYAGFTVDMAWRKATDTFLGTRLTQRHYSVMNAGDVQEYTATHRFDFSGGWGQSTSGDSWMFKRAPGFFDMAIQVATNGVPFKHNLGVPPELIMQKDLYNVVGWDCHAPAVGPGVIPLSNIGYSAGNAWTTDDTTYTPGSASPTRTYLSLMWASVPGICDIGTYTGTGLSQDIDCGFATGARFVLIKRTDATGDWYIWDTNRGIIVGNDPYYLLNSNAAEVTNADYIDPLASGFTVTATAPAALNDSGGTYLYMAIA